MSTNTLIEQQRHIFQQLQKVTNDYLGEVEEAETRRENGIQMAVAKRDQAQAIVNTQLEEMRQM